MFKENIPFCSHWQRFIVTGKIHQVNPSMAEASMYSLPHQKLT
jgi:hypothetical protein